MGLVGDSRDEGCAAVLSNWQQGTFSGGHPTVHLRAGVPQKGIYRANKDLFPNFSRNIRALKLRFLAFPGGPGGFRKVREAGRNHFHLSWDLIVIEPGITNLWPKILGGMFLPSTV